MTAPRRRRWPWILLAILIAIPLAGFVALRAFVNPEAIRPRLVAAVQDATGRDFKVGDIGLAISLRPTVELRDVALANAPGGSRPEMLTARRVEVQAALLPLLSSRVEIARVVIEQPDLLLETTADGRANWEFRPQGQPAPQQAPQPAPQTAPTSGQRMQFTLDSLHVEDGRVTYRDGRGGTTETVEIPSLDASAALAGPTTARGTLKARGQELAVEATTGALAALGGAAAWPYDVKLGLAGGEAHAKGALTGNDWTADAEARVPDLARLAQLLPDTPLPPLRDISASGKLAGTGAAIRSAEAIALRIGGGDLSVLRPGLALQRLEMTAPRLDQPLTLAAEAGLNGVEVKAGGTLGTPALLLGQTQGAVPVDLRVEAAGAQATVKGAVRELRAMAGVDLALAARVPDLSALAPLAGTPLPAIRDIAAETRLAERTPGFAGGAHLRALKLTSPPAEASGDITLVVGERPGLTGRLDVARLDVDAIRAAMPGAAAQPASQPAPQGQRPAGDGRIIPDLPLPAGALRAADADFTLAVANLTAGGASWRDLQARLQLEAGQGRIAPFSVATPGGPLQAELTADARGQAPTLHLVARSPGLDLASLQRAFGAPVRVSGKGELDTDLRGAGAGLRAVAASLAGHFGFAMLDATLEPPLLQPIEAALRAKAPILPPLPERLPVECVALRADAQGGVARIGTLLVDSPAAKVAGTGTVNLGTEAVSLRVLHDVRAAGTTTRVAANVEGMLANPRYGGVEVQNLGELLGALAGRVGGDAGALLGALGGQAQGGRPQPLPDCGPALTAARGGRQGPVPAARPAQAAPSGQAQGAAAQQQQPATPQIPGPAGDLLRGLLRR